ncbi:MAG: nicotinate-nucleotide--dimethylbenzimidazole phosphoribosyltransferase [Planctomycetota bacterium]
MSADIDRLQIQERIANLCKPPGSLGVIERVAEQLCLTQGTLHPKTRPRSATIFAADHGVVSEGVSAWPSSITAAVVKQMQLARTASGVFAQQLDCDFGIVDVGLLEPIEHREARMLDCADRRGSGNLRREAAMSEADFQHAWKVGSDIAKADCNRGMRVLIGGEMGIGNTTSATCLIALLCGLESETEIKSMVGPGAGASDEQLERKREVVLRSIERVRSLGDLAPIQVGCQVGGLEIVALAGYYAAGATGGCSVVVDGVIASAAALLAEAIQPDIRMRMIAGHRSTEPAQQIAHQHLSLDPILDLQMRLGEASGALAALPIIDLAAAMINDMASLNELEG